MADVGGAYFSGQGCGPNIQALLKQGHNCSINFRSAALRLWPTAAKSSARELRNSMLNFIEPGQLQQDKTPHHGRPL